MGDTETKIQAAIMQRKRKALEIAKIAKEALEIPHEGMLYTERPETKQIVLLTAALTGDTSGSVWQRTNRIFDLIGSVVTVNGRSPFIYKRVRLSTRNTSFGPDIAVSLIGGRYKTLGEFVELGDSHAVQIMHSSYHSEIDDNFPISVNLAPYHIGMYDIATNCNPDTIISANEQLVLNERALGQIALAKEREHLDRSQVN